MNRHATNQTEFLDFYLPFNGRLNTSNRWAKLADMVPWDVVESCYAESLAGTGQGAPAKSGRIAYGALLIKERLGITDEETAAQIMENPYLQYFLGMRELQLKPLFDPSMMVHFRSRFSQEHHKLINSQIIAAATGAEAEVETDESDKNGDDEDPPENAGKLLVDATCTPADIRYPTDLSLLNEAREKTEAVIDQFHGWITEETEDSVKKPRTYRQKARKQYLAVAKQKKPGAKKVRQAVRRPATELCAAQSRPHRADEQGASGATLEAVALRLQMPASHPYTLRATASDAQAACAQRSRSHRQHQPAPSASDCPRQGWQTRRVRS